MLAGFEGLQARASQITRYRFSWRGLDMPRHRCMRCIMMSFATTGGSHEKHTQPRIFIGKFCFALFCFVFVFLIDDNSQDQTLIIDRLFQSCMSNNSPQEKLNIRNIFALHLTVTRFLIWVNLRCFWSAEDECSMCRAWGTNGANTNKNSLLF